MYRQGIPELDLYIERGTERTPDQRNFYVFAGRHLAGPYRTLKAAKSRYDQLKAEAGYKPPKRELDPEERRRLVAKEAQEEMLLRHELFWAAGGDRYRRDGSRR